MLEALSTLIEKTHHRLAELVEKIEDQSDDFSDDATDLWRVTKPKLHSMQDSLFSAAQAIHQQSDEAQLKAHLATMDAQDQWSYLSQAVTELAHNAREKGQYQIQHADLQAHLTKMETRDFMKSSGQVIKQDYRQAKHIVEKASQSAAQELAKSMQSIGNALSSTM